MEKECNCEKNLNNLNKLTDDEWTCPVHGRMTWEFNIKTGESLAVHYDPETY